MFNMSLTSGVNPDLLKTAKTTPIYKKSSKLKTCNYRPISLLSNLNKIPGKLMFKFLEQHKCIYDQFGFRKKHSTNQALIKITETIWKALDKDDYACGILYELREGCKV